MDRGRPEAVLHDVVVYGPSATGLGFPSGHAAVAALIMTVAAPYLTRRAEIVGWVVVGLVAFTRVLHRGALPAGRAGRAAPGLGGRQRDQPAAGHAGRAAEPD